MGKSRSVTLVLAYIMQYRDMHLRAAFELVYSRRSVIKPNRGFMQTLIEFEKKLYPTLEKPTIEVEEWVGIVGEHGFANHRQRPPKSNLPSPQSSSSSSSSSSSPQSREEHAKRLTNEHLPDTTIRELLATVPLKRNMIGKAIQVGRQTLESNHTLQVELHQLRLQTKQLWKEADEKVKRIFLNMVEEAQ